MNKLRFCENHVMLNGAPLSFAGRPYLPAIYAVDGRNLVLRCSRQTEKSTFLANTILYESIVKPGHRTLFVCPREQQARLFSRTRLLQTVEKSPVLRRLLLGGKRARSHVMNIEFKNGSIVHVRAAYHSGDACRGVSADLLLVDEFQDVAGGDLPVLQETLSHARYGRTILTGTPKSIDNHLEAMFSQSTANEWTIPCKNCGKSAILDERALGPSGLICPECSHPLTLSDGDWRPRNPTSSWGEGFWIGHPMVKWVNFDGILERQRTYDIAKFRNEVLGLSTTTGDHVVTRSELEACCRNIPMASRFKDVRPAGRPFLVAGIDWGGGGRARTVLVIGFMNDSFQFEVCRFERFPGTEDPDYVLNQVVQRCREFRVNFIAADGGGHGHVYNRMLLNKSPGPDCLYAILYSATDHPPQRDGALFKWTVNRSASIGVVVTRVKQQKLIFPQVEDCGSFLDEFACEVAEYDDNARSIKYTHPESQQDDALHATNYALLIALREYQGRGNNAGEFAL